MLFKLSLTGMKSRFKDYLVLFSGLIVTSAIFYMFLSLSTNPGFLDDNPTVKIVKQLFLIGNVLLGIITLVYVTYANSFLLSMRQRDYGLFMMLGAKSSKIGNLIFIETLFLGILATLIGSFLGIFVTQAVGALLVSSLGLSIKGFIGFHLPAVLWTLLFFAVLFLLAALFNRIKISATSVLSLLKGNKKPVTYRRNNWLLAIQAVIGVAGLVVAYYESLHIREAPNALNAFWIILFGIVLGTYFVFKSSFPVIINLLKKWSWFNNRKLNNFTLNQLKFRITSYTRILSVVSILFAMAVGAITLALMMRDTAFEQADHEYYDVLIYQETPEVSEQLSKLSITDQVHYHYKIVDGSLYGIDSELNNQKFTINELQNTSVGPDTTLTYALKSYSGQEIEDYIRQAMISAYNSQQKDDSQQLSTGVVDNESRDYVVKTNFVSQQAFDQLSGSAGEIKFVKTTSMRQNLIPLQKITNLQGEVRNPTDGFGMQQGINVYQQANSVLSIFQFIGLFLGISFLTMLASILIFKILSGAHQDQQRYEMLDKIGARSSTMTKSIARELAILFILPGAMGVMHMLFGLKLFEQMVSNIYSRIPFPLAIFLGLYFLYYLLTLFIYRSIVLRKRK
ncbi:FtsX-like permease family protein [Holzapfeliella sp. He02]|uniref:FtsX-like permease family protein n=1 Tax=Holzapfeliella saturejae TaxID=3082953 RepID=A0ABU8SEA0_9LACO